MFDQSRLFMTQKFQSRIYITLRPSVLDTAGVAIETGLHQLGYQGVENVRIGKYIELVLTAKDAQEADAQLHQMCQQLLANPVIENYRFEFTPL